MDEAPEALGLIPAKAGGRPALLACGYDTRALVFALLDLLSAPVKRSVAVATFPTFVQLQFQFAEQSGEL